MEADADVRAYEALSLHPRVADLAAVTRASMTAATETRRAERQPERVTQIAGELRLSREDAATPFGNALDVLERGPEDDAERALACALAAHVVTLNPPQDRDGEDRLANDLLWLAAHTPFDATGLLDRALGDKAANLWDALADRIRRIDQGKLPALGRGEGLVAATALAMSSAKGAARQAAVARDRGPRPQAGTRPRRGGTGRAGRAARGGDGARSARARGDCPPGRDGHPLRRAGRAAGRASGARLQAPGRAHALRGRRAFASSWRIELLGRTLRDRDVLVPRTALAPRHARGALPAPRRSTRGCSRSPWAATSASSAFVDGVRAASPSLLATGLAIVALGLALDFALSSIVPGARGQCRLLVVPRDGAKLCVGGVDTGRADAVLARLARP